MKKAILTFSLLTSFLLVVGQTIWIADNRPMAPSGDHIVATIQAAIDSAAPGDYIYVMPSSSLYDDPYIYKDSITLLGNGFNPSGETKDKVWVLYITIAFGTNGTRISGINVERDLYIGESGNGLVSNVLIENGDVNRILADRCCGSLMVKNILIRNNVIGLRETNIHRVIDLFGSYVQSHAVVITNNVIMGSSTSNTGSISVSNGIVKNNLFLGNGDIQDRSYWYVTQTIVSNNIFYGRNQHSATNGITNSTFRNNISYGSALNEFWDGLNGVTSTNNYENVDPMLVNVLLVDDWDYEFDATPVNGSTAIGNGTDGTDIGLTSGTLPFDSYGSSLPLIELFRVPEIIKQGTDLKTNIKAKGN